MVVVVIVVIVVVVIAMVTVVTVAAAAFLGDRLDISPVGVLKVVLVTLELGGNMLGVRGNARDSTSPDGESRVVASADMQLEALAA